MAVQLLEAEFPSDRLPLLRWLLFTGVCAFGFVLAWHYGLFHLMLASDKTYISLVIVILYVATSVHCLTRTLTISREMDSAQRVAALVRQGVDGFSVAGENVITTDGRRLPPGEVTAHIRNLILKARTQGHHRLDQTLLLRGLADEARPSRYHHRIYPDAGPDRGPRLGGPRLGQKLHGPHERRHGGCHVHHAHRPDRLGACSGAILPPRRGYRKGVRAGDRYDRGVRCLRPRARAEWIISASIPAKSSTLSA